MVNATLSDFLRKAAFVTPSDLPQVPQNSMPNLTFFACTSWKDIELSLDKGNVRMFFPSFEFRQKLRILLLPLLRFLNKAAEFPQRQRT